MSAGTDSPTSISSTSWEPSGGGRRMGSQIQSPLFVLLTQITVAADNGLDLLAVSMAVALPDICGALASDDGKADYGRYRDWCRDNLKVGFDNFTPEDLYSMRCGMLHQGRLHGLKHGIKKVVLLPGREASFSDCTADKTTYIYSTITFCKNMNRAVVTWYEANHTDPNVTKNLADLMQYREGVYEVQGMTVIA